MTMLKTVTETASGLGNDARDSVEKLGRDAGRRLDVMREETGDALHGAASSVRRSGRQGSKAIDDLTTGAADRLDATASYIERHDLRAVMTDMRRFGRRHPAGTFLIAASLGFLAGSAFSRATRSSD